MLSSHYKEPAEPRTRLIPSDSPEFEQIVLYGTWQRVAAAHVLGTKSTLEVGDKTAEVMQEFRISSLGLIPLRNILLGIRATNPDNAERALLLDDYPLTGRKRIYLEASAVAQFAVDKRWITRTMGREGIILPMGRKMEADAFQAKQAAIVAAL